MVRKSKGRQKLQMVKIPSESHLMVTFSKRRSGIFRKASELSTLCGAEVAIVVFSPGKKVFSFGHPSVENVTERFLSGIHPQNPSAFQRIEGHRNAMVCQLNMQLTQVLEQLEIEKKRGQELDRLRKDSQILNWWENPIGELDMAQLEQLKASLEELKHDVARQAERNLIQNSKPPQPLMTQNTSSNGILPFDNWRSGFNTNNMAMAPLNTNTNTNMTSPPLPYNSNMSVAPYGYNPGYGNGNLGYGNGILGYGNGFF
ncbi:unnamed protein product [Dovyalis caffra]|uniref:MADS-box domain-containing protein n=1 Tax=Dovyalis caffra TaxID=77055 RepID=A0AAV1SR03_9ROSI|nr:unnamed protein product [Dovyalis caffra]